MYMKNDVPGIGFLETIVSLKTNNESALIIRPVNLISTGDTLSIEGQVYRCTNLLDGSYGGTTLEVINLNSIVQKLVFRPGTDIKSPPCQNSMFFFSILIEVVVLSCNKFICFLNRIIYINLYKLKFVSILQLLQKI